MTFGHAFVIGLPIMTKTEEKFEELRKRFLNTTDEIQLGEYVYRFFRRGDQFDSCNGFYTFEITRSGIFSKGMCEKDGLPPYSTWLYTDRFIDCLWPEFEELSGQEQDQLMKNVTTANNFARKS